MKRGDLLYYVFAGMLAALLVLLIGFLYFPATDYSARQVAGQRVFGSAMQTLADPYYEAMDNKLRSIAESRGDVLVSRDARQRGDKQLEQIYELIGQKPDGIFVSAVDWAQIKPALEAAEAAGIPVIALDAEEGLSETAATVSTDPYEAGLLCARDLMRRLDGARVMVLGQTGNRYSEQFVLGFKETLREGYTVVSEGDCDRELATSSRVSRALLGENGEVDAIVAVNDQSAIGALATLERLGLLGQVLVYGVDGSPEAKNAVQKGLMAGTVTRHPYQTAQLAADAMYELLDSGELASRTMQVSTHMVTEDNIANFDVTSWQ